MPAVKGEGMRGLSVFISDIRNCKYKPFVMRDFTVGYISIVCSINYKM